MFRFGFLLMAVCLVAGVTHAEQTTSALTLLNKLQANLDQIKSCWLKYEYSMKSDALWEIPAFKNANGLRKKYKAGEFRFDGNRYSIRDYEWGQIAPEHVRPRESAAYTSILWNGRRWHQYGYNPLSLRRNGTVIVAEDDQVTTGNKVFALGPAFVGRFLFGYYSSHTLRIDSMLRQSSKMTVSVDHNYLMIEAVTKWGEFGLWLDPAHGYNLSRVEGHTRAGDLDFAGEVAPEGFVEDYLITNMTFRLVDRLWVPVEGYMNAYAVYPGRARYVCARENFKITEITLHPEFDKLKAFGEEDVREGARALMVGTPGEYVWSSGKIMK